MRNTPDPPYIDYHEEFPDRWQLAGNYKRCCAKCGEIKHPKAFRKIITRAQAEARGYLGDPTDRPMHVESRFCAHCRGEWLRPSQIRRASPAKLQDEVNNGRLREQIFVMEMNRRRKDPSRTLKARQVRGGINKWKNFYRERWVWARAKVAEELRFLDEREDRAVKRLDQPMHAALLEFGNRYRKTLAKLRAESNYFKLQEARAADALTWEEWVGVNEYAQLWRSWRAIEQLRGRGHGRPLRVPMVLDTAMPGVFARCPLQQRRELAPDLLEQIEQFADDQARGMRRIR